MSKKAPYTGTAENVAGSAGGSGVGAGRTIKGVRFAKPTKHKSSKEVFSDADVRRQAEGRGMGRFLREGLNITDRTNLRKAIKKFKPLTDNYNNVFTKEATIQQRKSLLRDMRFKGIKVNKRMEQWANSGKRTRPTKGEKPFFDDSPATRSGKMRRLKDRQVSEREASKEAAENKAKRINYIRQQMVEATKKSGGDETVRTRNPKQKGRKALGFKEHMDSRAAKTKDGAKKLAARKRLGKAQSDKLKRRRQDAENPRRAQNIPPKKRTGEGKRYLFPTGKPQQ